MNRLNEEGVRAVKSPDVVDCFVGDGGEPIGNTVDVAIAHFRRQAEKYARILTNENVRAD